MKTETRENLAFATVAGAFMCLAVIVGGLQRGADTELIIATVAGIICALTARTITARRRKQQKASETLHGLLKKKVKDYLAICIGFFGGATIALLLI